MKKFLFTLAALMMAGSAMANDYFYLADFEVPQSALGASGAAGRIFVDVKAHFDNYVSAWQVDFEVPEGLTIAAHRAGTDLTLHGLDDFGDPKDFTPNLKVSADKLRVIVASDEAGYTEDGEMYGAMKWAPGEYAQMWQVVFNATADFAGGAVKVKTQPACGQDTRPGVTPTNGVTTDFDDLPACVVTVEGATPTPEDFVGTASVVFNENVATISYTSNDPNADVVVTVNGTETEVNWNRAAGTATWTAPINTTPGQYSYTVKLTVTPDGENFVGEPVSAQDTYAYEVLEKTATPVITIVEEHHNWVSFDVEGDGTVLVYVDGNLVEPAADGHYYVYASTEADVTYVVTATAQENGKEISDTATETIEIAKWDAVNELVNGKTIANVRYFNMAGQEMQSVNGMTIKVITYTDGTTSAVKVMK